MSRPQLTIAEKQARKALRDMAKDNGAMISRQSEIAEKQAQEQMAQFARYVEMERGNDASHNRTYLLGEAIRRVTSVVSASFAIDQPVVYNYQHPHQMGDSFLSARTDLKTIMLSLNTMRLEKEQTKKVIALIKGATYHEVAHCLWTPTFRTLMESIPTDEHDPWLRKYHRAWNLLEDGRIESLLIQRSPVIRNYLLPLLYEVVLQMDAYGNDRDMYMAKACPFLLVRRYLPEGLKRTTMKAINEYCANDHTIDRNIPKHMIKIAREYQECTSWAQMIPLVESFHALWQLWKGDVIEGGDLPSGEPEHEPTGEGEGKPIPVPVNRGDITDDWDENEFDTPSIPVPKPVDTSDEDDDSEGEGDATDESDAPEGQGQGDDKDDKPSDNPSDSSDDTTGGDEDKTTKADETKIKDEADKAIDDAVSVEELNEVEAQFNKMLAQKIVKCSDTTPITSDAQITKSDMLRSGMINALESVVVTASPAWVYHQDDGSTFDVESFYNREMGDDAFWMNKVGNGERGHDLSISMLLDCSSSMDSHLTSLGIVAYAIRSACDHFEIPCTTTVFGFATRMLWDADEEPSLVIPPDMGGTHIHGALMDIPNQRRDKTRHLVVILTDGEWSDAKSVMPYIKDEHTLLVNFGHGSRNNNRGCDEVVVIKDLLDLPREVEHAITRFF